MRWNNNSEFVFSFKQKRSIVEKVYLFIKENLQISRPIIRFCQQKFFYDKKLITSNSHI